MQREGKPRIAIPVPIVIPSAPIPSERRQSQQPPVALEYVSDISSGPPTKRHKKDRACDYCRRRKIKCDGPWMRDHVCTNCVHSHRSCTYMESSKPRGPPKAYVAALEDRMERLESIISQLSPNTDFAAELGPAVVRGSWREDSPQGSCTSQSPMFGQSSNNSLPPPSLAVPRPNASPTTGASFPGTPVNRTTHLVFQPSRNARPRSHIRRHAALALSSSDDSCSDSSEETVETWVGGRQRLTLSALESADEVRGNSIRFHGRSSTASLVEVTRKFKHLCMEERKSQGDLKDENQQDKVRKANKPAQRELVDLTRSLGGPDNEKIRATRRAKFWSTPKWESAWGGHNTEVSHLITSVLGYFPSSGVAARLFDLFFRHTNTYLPLLHRPTFERQWQQQLHHTNIWFTNVCILMFAIASRWYGHGEDGMDDLLDPAVDRKAIGWRWFFVVLEVHRIQRNLFLPATLFEVQTFALMALFLRGTTCGPIGWLFTSIGIRKAQDRGAHRRKVYKSIPNADDELWKRAFWVLLAFDRITGASLGRGASVGEEDYDLDMPLEVDDEYWETGDPEKDFKQPANIPSKLACFTQFIKLARIIGFTTKTLYPVNSSEIFYGLVKGDWTEEALKQLKSAMEEWTENVPSHLRWSEDIEDPVFASQSATIYTLYHCVQMTIWRQFCVFNPSATTPVDSPKRSPSAMGICAMSIRACVRILDIQTRSGISNVPHMINVALVCAGTVAMILWELRRKIAASEKGNKQIRMLEIEGTGICVHTLLDDLKVCIRMLESKESRWEWAKAVLDKLKDALPSDEEDSLEDLDVSTGSQPTDKTGDVISLPVDFDDNGNASNPHIFRDGTISFLEHCLYQMDDFPATVPQSHSRDQGNGAPSTKTYDSALGAQLLTSGNSTLPRSSDFDYCENFAKDNGARNGGVRWGDPHLQAQPLQNPRIHRPSQLLQNSSSQLRPPFQASNFASPNLQAPVRRRKSAATVSSLLPSGPPRPSPSHRPGGESLARVFPGPATGSSNALSQNVAVRGSEFCSDKPSIPEWRESSGEEQAVQHRHYPRVRAISLASSPVQTGRERAVPCISASLRRTSVPNLQIYNKDDRLFQQELETDVLQLRDDMQLRRVTNESAIITQPSFRLPTGENQHTSSSNYLNAQAIGGSSVKDRSRMGDIGYFIPANNGQAEIKPGRSTEFRHWNKYPLPPTSTGSDMNSSEITQYTHHQFVLESPYSR